MAARSARGGAATCADQPVTARGDPSRLEVLAKAKARGNWRAKVRAMPALGAAYADWYKAQAADYRCEEAAASTSAWPSPIPAGTEPSPAAGRLPLHRAGQAARTTASTSAP